MLVLLRGLNQSLAQPVTVRYRTSKRQPAKPFLKKTVGSHKQSQLTLITTPSPKAEEHHSVQELLPGYVALADVLKV